MFSSHVAFLTKEEERYLSLNRARSLSLNRANAPFHPSPVLPIAASIRYFEARL